MHSRFTGFVLVFAFSLASAGWCQSAAPGPEQSSAKGAEVPENPQATTKVPTGVILVKGAWSSASDSVTPVPEGGIVTGGAFRDEYFGITYGLPKDWTEKYHGPPPSDSGRYVLAQLQPAETSGTTAGHILITAQDLFFTPLPTANPLELASYEKDNLQSDYKLDVAPKQIKVASRAFSFYAYSSPVAGLRWYVLGTEIRCHAVEFVLTSRDTKLLDSWVADMSRMQLPAEASASGGQGGGAFPVCIKDYAKAENLIARVDPVLTDHRFSPIPVRIIIDKSGKVKHIHFLSAFPGQDKVIADALQQWKFKPYMQDGQPVEVETGIMFGRAPPALTSSQDAKPSTK